PQSPVVNLPQPEPSPQATVVATPYPTGRAPQSATPPTQPFSHSSEDRAIANLKELFNGEVVNTEDPNESFLEETDPKRNL
ncbi:MAG: hypothetical protein ACUVSQ_12275, partial [Pseudanabaenaceae cyanobacterium]